MTTDVEALIARLDARKWLGGKPESSLDAQAAAALRSQAERIAGLLEQHARDSAELRRLCDERDKAKREVKTWQDATGICNQANERMQAAAMEAGCPDETEVADWIIESHNSKSAMIHALQKALAYWMPRVFDERSGHDAYLLVGYEGEAESECWGDKAQERIQKQALENISLFDQCRQALDERDKAKSVLRSLYAKLMRGDVEIGEAMLRLVVYGAVPTLEEFVTAITGETKEKS